MSDNPVPWREDLTMRVAGVFQGGVLSTVRHDSDEVSNCERQFGDSPRRFAQSEQIDWHRLMTRWPEKMSLELTSASPLVTMN